MFQGRWVRLLVLSLACLVVEFSAFADSVPKATCVPSNKESANWPVKAVYLHGLFAGGSDDINGFRQLERENRKKLEALASKLKIRIAVPRGDRPKGKTYYQWNRVSFSDIESRASQACGGEKLSSPRALIGFSNGAMKSLRIGQLDCGKSLKNYSLILSMGSPVEIGTQKCPGQKQVNWSRHAFPGGDKVSNLLTQALPVRLDKASRTETPNEEVNGVN